MKTLSLSLSLSLTDIWYYSPIWRISILYWKTQFFTLIIRIELKYFSKTDRSYLLFVGSLNSPTLRLLRLRGSLCFYYLHYFWYYVTKPINDFFITKEKYLIYICRTKANDAHYNEWEWIVSFLATINRILQVKYW